MSTIEERLIVIEEKLGIAVKSPEEINRKFLEVLSHGTDIVRLIIENTPNDVLAKILLGLDAKHLSIFKSNVTANRWGHIVDDLTECYNDCSWDAAANARQKVMDNLQKMYGIIDIQDYEGGITLTGIEKMREENRAKNAAWRTEELALAQIKEEYRQPHSSIEI